MQSQIQNYIQSINDQYTDGPDSEAISEINFDTSQHIGNIQAKKLGANAYIFYNVLLDADCIIVTHTNNPNTIFRAEYLKFPKGTQNIILDDELNSFKSKLYPFIFELSFRNVLPNQRKKIIINGTTYYEPEEFETTLAIKPKIVAAPKNSWTVGRDINRVDIPISNEYQKVSRLHMRIWELDNSMYRVEDLESANGTFHMENGQWQPITTSKIVAADDPIMIAFYETTVAKLLKFAENVKN